MDRIISVFTGDKCSYLSESGMNNTEDAHAEIKKKKEKE